MIMIIIDKKRFSGGGRRRFLLADDPSLWPSPNLCRRLMCQQIDEICITSVCERLGSYKSFEGGRSKLDGSRTSFDGVQQTRPVKLLFLARPFVVVVVVYTLT
jgi:hypothetical protein